MSTDVPSFLYVFRMSRKRSASSSLEGTLLEQTLKASEAGEQIELADIPEDLEQALEDSALLRPPGEEVLVERSPSPPAHHALMRQARILGGHLNRSFCKIKKHPFFMSHFFYSFFEVLTH